MIFIIIVFGFIPIDLYNINVLKTTRIMKEILADYIKEKGIPFDGGYHITIDKTHQTYLSFDGDDGFGNFYVSTAIEYNKLTGDIEMRFQNVDDERDSFVKPFEYWEERMKDVVYNMFLCQ